MDGALTTLEAITYPSSTKFHTYIQYRKVPRQRSWIFEIKSVGGSWDIRNPNTEMFTEGFSLLAITPESIKVSNT